VHTDTNMQLRQRLFASAADRWLLDPRVCTAAKPSNRGFPQASGRDGAGMPQAVRAH
jgi:hypothetical protein